MGRLARGMGEGREGEGMDVVHWVRGERGGDGDGGGGGGGERG